MMRRWARTTAGFALLAAGAAGWLLPIIPGWALVIPGLMILAKEYHWARRLLDRAKKLRPQKSEQH